METLTLVLAVIVAILGCINAYLSTARIKKLERAKVKAETDAKLASAELARTKEVLCGVQATLDIWLDAEPAELIYTAYHRIQIDFMYNSQIKQARRAAAKIMGIRLPCDKERKCST